MELLSSPTVNRAALTIEESPEWDDGHDGLTIGAATDVGERIALCDFAIMEDGDQLVWAGIVFADGGEGVIGVANQFQTAGFGAFAWIGDGVFDDIAFFAVHGET